MAVDRREPSCARRHAGEVTRDADALRTPYRPVRPVGAPDDGPWPGLLVSLASGERRVLVDATVLGDDWRGWDASPHDHVLAPLDIVRRSDGHDVALPVCTERIADLLARRAAHGPRLTPGEAVTLGVSLLRGCAELRDRAGVAGDWWLTETGRPVFATDASSRTARETSAALLAGLATTARADGWSDAEAAILAERPSAAEFERAEALLFEIAEPLPITTASSGPRSARELSRAELTDVDRAVAEERPRPWDGVLRHVDADLADLVSRATTRLWRRATATRAPSRRAPWLIAGAAATVVLGAGLLWPSDGDDAATAEVPVATPSASAIEATATPSAEPKPAPTPSGAAPDLIAVAADLLDRRRACEGDLECLRPVVLDPESSWPAGPIDAPGDQRSIVLLDDFGGVAVLRVDAEPAGAASQLVVIERRDGEWLLRDVHDAAQQP